jgi:DNA-directed RNA polymerase subunit D
MVKVHIRELTPRRCKLLIEEASPYFVNSLRRTLISEVPKLAINDVILYDNNSGLFDEIVAHRVGLLPVPTDVNAMNFRDQCVCNGQGCPNCTVRYTLSKEGPGMVYSRDLQPENTKLALADPDVPIVELLKGQRLILEAEAILGRGRDHAKWQSCSGVGYRYVPILRNTKETVDALVQIARTVPADAARVQKGREEVFDQDGIVTLSDATLDAAEKQGISVKWDETRFQFRFETDGSLTPQQALLKAVEIMKVRLEEFETKASKLKVVTAEA